MNPKNFLNLTLKIIWPPKPRASKVPVKLCNKCFFPDFDNYIINLAAKNSKVPLNHKKTNLQQIHRIPILQLGRERQIRVRRKSLLLLLLLLLILFHLGLFALKFLHGEGARAHLRRERGLERALLRLAVGGLFVLARGLALVVGADCDARRGIGRVAEI